MASPSVGDLRIEVVITVRNIIALGYEDAKAYAWEKLMLDPDMRRIVVALGINSREEFTLQAKAAKECNGSFTVIVP